MTGLLEAVENGDLATVRSLLGSGVKPDDDAFYHACEQSNVELLGLLYRPGYERLVNHKLDFEDTVGLRWFLDHDVVKSLVDSGLAVDTRGWSNFTPLDQAAMHGRTDVVRLLIARRRGPGRPRLRRGRPDAIGLCALGIRAQPDRRRRLPAASNRKSATNSLPSCCPYPGSNGVVRKNCLPTGVLPTCSAW